jgi:hypothetical protein
MRMILLLRAHPRNLWKPGSSRASSRFWLNAVYGCPRKRPTSREGKRHWVFKAEDDKGNPIRLYKAFLTPVTRHTKIQGKANPFDPAWESYFEQRYTKK